VNKLDFYRVARYISDANAFDRLEPVVKSKIEERFGAGRGAILDCLVSEGLVIAEKTTMISNGTTRENTIYSITEKGRKTMAASAKRRTIVNIVADEPASYADIVSVFGKCDGDVYWLLHRGYIRPTDHDGIKLQGRSFVATDKGRAALVSGTEPFEGHF